MFYVGVSIRAQLMGGEGSWRGTQHIFFKSAIGDSNLLQAKTKVRDPPLGSQTSFWGVFMKPQTIVGSQYTIFKKRQVFAFSSQYATYTGRNEIKLCCYSIFNIANKVRRANKINNLKENYVLLHL